jgi:ATP-binding cassette subfamily B (MDR/TAP) protein 1
VGNFTDYFVEGTSVTKAEFQAELNKMALYIVYLFIAKFVLSYIAMVRKRAFCYWCRY